MGIDTDSAQIRFPPPLAFLGTFLAALALGAVTGRPELPLGDELERVSGWLLVAAGGAVMMTAAGLFRTAGTAARPWLPSSALVTGGVYRWTRNPMYLSMAAIYLGLALVLDSLAAVVLLVPLIFVIQREVIEREEAYLERRFGAEYLSYKSTTRRWI